MHNLVPKFILNQYRIGEHHGSFPAVGMFVDISGFSPAAGVKRSKIVLYAQVQLLSRDELNALLRILICAIS